MLRGEKMWDGLGNILRKLQNYLYSINILPVLCGGRVKFVPYETVWNYEGCDTTCCLETQQLKSLKCQTRQTLSIIAPCPAGIWDVFHLLSVYWALAPIKKTSSAVCQPCQSRFGFRVFLLLDRLLIKATDLSLLFYLAIVVDTLSSMWIKTE